MWSTDTILKPGDRYPLHTHCTNILNMSPKKIFLYKTLYKELDGGGYLDTEQYGCILSTVSVFIVKKTTLN
jgi:hypothetical protein